MRRFLGTLLSFSFFLSLGSFALLSGPRLFNSIAAALPAFPGMKADGGADHESANLPVLRELPRSAEADLPGSGLSPE